MCGVFAGIITSRALGADGIGFAVPIDQAVEQIPHILRNKPQVTPCMGCKLATLIDNDSLTRVKPQEDHAQPGPMDNDEPVVANWQ